MPLKFPIQIIHFPKSLAPSSQLLNKRSSFSFKNFQNDNVENDDGEKLFVLCLLVNDRENFNAKGISHFLAIQENQTLRKQRESLLKMVFR